MGYIKEGIKEAIRIARREPRITPGQFDLQSLPALLGKDDPVILEIGCNDGGQTGDFLKLFSNPRIYAFEPDPRARARFSRVIQDPRVQLFDVAISASNGEVEFHMSSGAPSEDCAQKLPDGWDLSGSIRKPTGHLALHPWCTFDQRIMVRTMTLDAWCAQQGVTDIDFIWADVQGAEGDLISGGKTALARTRFFYTEYCDRELYDGQITLRTMLNLLPEFTVLHRFAGDVLLKNTLR